MPTLGAQLFPEVQPERPVVAYQGVRPQPGSFGGYTGEAHQRLGAAIEQAGGTAADIRIRFQHQQNETAVDAANTAYDNRRREMLFGEGGFYTKKGKDAYEAMKPTSEAIEELRQSMREGLRNPEQQRMFDTFSRRSTALDLRSMSMHAATENQQYRVNVAEAALGNSMADITAYWNDPYRFAKGLGDVRVHAENRARLLGHTDPEQVRSEVAHYEGLAWVARIKATMAENPLMARDMYEANKDQIHDVPQKVMLEHELKVAVQPEEAKIIARRIIVGAPAGGAQPGGRMVPAADFPKETQPEALERAQAQLRTLEAEQKERPDDKSLQKEIDRSKELIGKLSAAPEGAAAQVPAAANAAVMPTTARDTKAQLAAWLPAAEREADRLHPGNQTFRDLVVSQITGYVNKITAMQEALSRQAHSTVMAAATNPAANGQKPLTLSELLDTRAAREAWALLTPEAQHGFVSANGVLAQNAREARGELVRSDPRLVHDLAQRMYLPDGDPQKISSPTQLTQYRGKGLNHSDYEALRKELAEANTPEGNPFLKQVNGIKGTARRMLLGSTRGIMHPDVAEEAAYRFGVDLDQKLKAARAAGRDPQELFVPGSKDYVLDINRVGGFMPSDAEIRAGAKPKPEAPAPQVQQRKPGESPADYLKRVGKG